MHDRQAVQSGRQSRKRYPVTAPDQTARLNEDAVGGDGQPGRDGHTNAAGKKREPAARRGTMLRRADMVIGHKRALSAPAPVRRYATPSRRSRH